MAFISEGSLGLRCSLRLDTEEDFPRLKKERQLPTGDFFILLGGLFLGRENRTHGWRGSCSSVLAACHQHSPLSAQKLLVSAWKLPLFHSRGCFHSSSSTLKSCWVNSPSLCKSSCSAGEERLLLVQSSSQGMDFMEEAPALWEAGQP